MTLFDLIRLLLLAQYCVLCIQSCAVLD